MFSKTLWALLFAVLTVIELAGMFTVVMAPIMFTLFVLSMTDAIPYEWMDTCLIAALGVGVVLTFTWYVCAVLAEKRDERRKQAAKEESMGNLLNALSTALHIMYPPPAALALCKMPGCGIWDSCTESKHGRCRNCLNNSLAENLAYLDANPSVPECLETGHDEARWSVDHMPIPAGLGGR